MILIIILITITIIIIVNKYQISSIKDKKYIIYKSKDLN